MLPASEKQGGCPQDEVGIGILTNASLTIQEILDKISQQTTMVGWRKVPSLQTAIVEFTSFQFKTVILSASPSEALASATGITIHVSAVYFDAKSSYVCVFVSSDASCDRPLAKPSRVF